MAKYMLIDVTTVPGTRFLAVAMTREVVALGKIAAAQGMKVIAPPLEGRGFSKLEKEQAQYLLWNATQIPPPEELGDCYRALLAHAETLPVDQTPLEQLEAQVRKLYPDEVTTPTAQSTGEPKAPRAPGEAPKAGSTTGRVWVIADQQYATVTATGETDWKVIRAAIVKACTADGINEATAATQYSKWKAAKLAAKAA